MIVSFERCFICTYFIYIYADMFDNSPGYRTTKSYTQLASYTTNWILITMKQLSVSRGKHTFFQNNKKQDYMTNNFILYLVKLFIVYQDLNMEVN